MDLPTRISAVVALTDIAAQKIGTLLSDEEYASARRTVFTAFYTSPAVVRAMFRISKVGTVAGCFVTQGTIERGAKARIYREGREIYKGAIDALKRFKDDAKEVREGFECGIKVAGYDDVKVDDVIEAYRVDQVMRTLSGKGEG